MMGKGTESGGAGRVELEHEVPKKRGHQIWYVSGGAHEWIQADRVVKSRNVRVYHLEPGWYEESRVDRIACAGCPHGECPAGETRVGRVSEFFAVTPAGQYWGVPASASEYVATIVAGPLPTEPGAWNSPRCRCGADVEGYTSEGMPYCTEHEPASRDEVLEDGTRPERQR